MVPIAIPAQGYAQILARVPLFYLSETAPAAKPQVGCPLYEGLFWTSRRPTGSYIGVNIAAANTLPVISE
jgi:hypothetical protein